MSYNRFYAYVMHNDPLAGNTTGQHTIRAEKDYHCFDIAGVPDTANIENLTVDIFFPNKPISKISNIPIDIQLIGTQAPGNSQWLFPFSLEQGEVCTITIVNPIATDFTFDLALFGYHRENSYPLGGCPPDKLVYYYSFDFGAVAAGAVGLRENVRIVSGYDFVCLGVVATPDAAANDVLEFKWVVDSRSEAWMSDYIMASALFQNVLATPRRIFWRIPMIFKSMEQISLYCTDISGAGQSNVEVALFGYHVLSGTSESLIAEDLERYKNAYWQ